MAPQRPIIIDCDPGQDDAVALLVALGSSELDIIGITAVAGNVPLKLTETNARKVCELANRTEIKVFAGHDAPLERPLVTAEDVHGRTGLDGPDLPEPTMKLQEAHATAFIINSLREHPARSVTLCPLGPLTNIAAAIEAAPDIISRIEEIVLMGGANFERGNVTPAAEFNIYVDPQAADIVFSSGVPITVMSLDVTHQALTTTERIAAFRSLGNPAGLATAEMMEFFARFDSEKYGTAGAPLHDPCVIAYLLQPDLFSGKMVNVEIETESELTMGMTVVDWWNVTNRPANAKFISTVDDDGYFNLLTERIGLL
ncbi:MAG: nucleoside hydrolase [Rhodobacteraceae bacterium]|nr:nucleoside hydrolase [Paracoccaceae bacterium]